MTLNDFGNKMSYGNYKLYISDEYPNDEIFEINNISDKNSRNEHVQNIKTTIKETEEKIQNNICPKCGGKLVERNGKYGKFIGCSNYPNCKYTDKINK